MFAVGIRAVDEYGAARFADTVDNRLAVVGNLAAGDITLTAADVIHHGGNVQYIAGCRRWRIVRHQHKIIRLRAGVARFIRCGGGDMVLTLWQRRGRRKLPCAFIISNRRTDMLTIVVNIDTAARLCGTVEGWVCVVGGAAIAQIAADSAHVIRCRSQHWFFRCGRIDGDIEGR